MLRNLTIIAVMFLASPVFADGESGNFVHSNRLTATNPWVYTGGTQAERLGASVASAGDVNKDGFADIIIGAPYYDTVTAADTGRVCVFYGSAQGLKSKPDWTAECDKPGAHFGCAVACVGDVSGDGYMDVVIGAKDYSSTKPPTPNALGRVYVYHGGANGLEKTPAWTMDAEPAFINGPSDTYTGPYFGASVSTAGDVNNDGYDDLLIGAPNQQDVTPGSRLYFQAGRAYVYHGSLTGLSTRVNWKIDGGSDYAHLGSSVAGGGRVNDDDASDVLIGAHSEKFNLTSLGKVYLYFGATTRGLDPKYQDVWWVWGAKKNPTNTLEPDPWFGSSLSFIEDLNRDGRDDFIVGAPRFDGRGKAYFFLGGNSLGTSGRNCDQAARWVCLGEGAGSDFASSVSTAGDVNGDVYPDLIIGAQYYASNARGKAYLFYGGGDFASTHPQAPDWTQEGTVANGMLGISVAKAGDVNGDGFSEIIVGEKGYGNNKGRVYVWSLNPSAAAPDFNRDGLIDSADLLVLVESLSQQSVSTPQDLDGDGQVTYRDLCIFAQWWNKSPSAASPPIGEKP